MNFLTDSMNERIIDQKEIRFSNLDDINTNAVDTKSDLSNCFHKDFDNSDTVNNQLFGMKKQRTDFFDLIESNFQCNEYDEILNDTDLGRWGMHFVKKKL